jgi:hypothetical protein
MTRNKADSPHFITCCSMFSSERMSWGGGTLLLDKCVGGGTRLPTLTTGVGGEASLFFPHAPILFLDMNPEPL